MTEEELKKLRDQKQVLMELLPRYGGKTLECIIKGITTRIHYNQERKNEEPEADRRNRSGIENGAAVG